MIKAPYNFVPIHEKVYFPDWAEKISYDIPFSDGESATIHLTLTAHSPVFVRNGSTADKETRFSNIDGRFFIPGTAIKGMIRSVLEIMSFGKLGNVTEWTPTYRDLSKSATGKKYKNAMQGVHCGWLSIDPNDPEKYTIQDCGKPKRIRHQNIDDKWGTDFAALFKTNPADAYKSAKGKIKDLEGKGWDLHTVYEFSQISGADPEQYEFCAEGPVQGTLVVTGQPGKRDAAKGYGKYLEFIFEDTGTTNSIPVPKAVVDNFKFAYYDGDPNNESKDWAYWKTKLYAGESIPVFFKTSGGKIQHFGLSYLYKLPYPHGIREAIDNLGQAHRSEALDLAQSIFGASSDKKALKGRVFFSPAFAGVDTARELNPITTVLGSPKPSYYPTYIQNPEGYNAGSLQLSGRKRYPVHTNVPNNLNPGTEKVSTTFAPLDTGVVFESKIRCHNLRTIEIGALLSALTFHGNNDQLFHSIGMAKPLGFGKIRLDIVPEGLKNDPETYMTAFVKAMEAQLHIDWKTSDQIVELFTMAKEQTNTGNSKLEYMELDEFSEERGSTLKLYSQLNQIIPFSMASSDDYLENIKGKSGDELTAYINENKNIDNFNIALRAHLANEPYKKEFKGYYQQFSADPRIAAKYINGLAKLNRQIIEPCINRMQGNIDRSKPEYQALFDTIFKKKYDAKIPEQGFPNYLDPLKYTCEDLWGETGITEDNCLDLLEDFKSRIWPPIDDFIRAVKNADRLEQEIKELIWEELGA
ncbi:TIGR03986 family type III CRISPR-associated RAMP protein [Desulfobacter latus]|uniref:TIGR03986 family CRISPR-associated RAMP protein n=1 Tax=Desulfobacter latus TaxID=2292 RepID=A0A850SRV2_9BACT|nr:TIGR03986 family CRISPR-associated RAMP protein [Desulfobacter latus]NWH03869.1 TIGR03986 family CRISPR-associated RAMP protein [Desulfobacter latus]